jgi:general secretion pathway protein D
MKKNAYVSLFLIFLLSTCSPVRQKPRAEGPSAEAVSQALAGTEASKPVVAQPEEKISPPEETKDRSEAPAVPGAAPQERKRGTEGAPKGRDRGLESSGEKPAPALEVKKDDEILINLEDVSLFEFSEAVFKDLLKSNYKIAPSLKDAEMRLSVRMTRPVPRSKMIPLVTTILKDYDVYLSQEGDFFILMDAKNRDSIVPKFLYGKKTPTPSELGLIFQIIPLDHLSPLQMDIILQRFVSKSGEFKADEATGSLIIIDYPDRIQKILEIVDVLDRQVFADVSLKIIKPTYWEPGALVKQLAEFLRVESIPVLKPREQAAGVLLLPIERLREVYIFSSKKEWLDRVLFYVEKLDTPDASGGEERPFIYFPTHAAARELGGAISQIFNMSQGIVESVRASGEGGGQGGTSGRMGRGGTQTSAPQASTSGGAAGETGKAGKIIVDEPRNCLIFITSPSEWANIKDLLGKLDIPAKQVLIEAVIAELTLDKKLQMGLEWFMKNQDVKFQKKEFTGSGGTEGGLGIGSVGFLYSLASDDQLFRMAINAFVSQNRLKIISAPRIIGRDNIEATIEVGTEVPVVTSEAAAASLQQEGTTSLLRSIQYRPTGVILRVIPTIHSDGAVSLQIAQEVSEAQTNQVSQISSPIILSRKITTSLVARNGQTVFIGGLISRNTDNTTGGVPFLSKIPLLGLLFKTSSSSERRTELIVLITPHVITESTELDFVSEEFQKKMVPEIHKFSLKEKKDEK